MLHLMGVQGLLMMGLTAGVTLLSTRPIHILRQVAKVIVLHHFNGRLIDLGILYPVIY